MYSFNLNLFEYCIDNLNYFKLVRKLLKKISSKIYYNDLIQ